MFNLYRIFNYDRHDRFVFFSFRYSHEKLILKMKLRYDHNNFVEESYRLIEKMCSSLSTQYHLSRFQQLTDSMIHNNNDHEDYHNHSNHMKVLNISKIQ